MNKRYLTPFTNRFTLRHAFMCAFTLSGIISAGVSFAMPDRTMHVEIDCQDQQPPSDEEDRKRKEEWMKKQEAIMREEALKAKIKRVMENARDGDAEKALKEIDEMLEEDADVPNINYFRGICYLKLGITEKAEAEFKTEIQRNPDSVDARMEIVKMRAAAGRTPASKDILEEILKIDPKHSEALQYLIGIYMDQADYKKVEKYLLDYAKTNPDNPATYLSLGDIYRLNIKDEKKSLENYNLYLQKDTEKNYKTELAALLVACVSGDKYELGLIEDQLSCEKSLGDSAGKFTEVKKGRILKDDSKEFVIKTTEGRDLHLPKATWSKADVKKGLKTEFAGCLEKYIDSVGRISGLTDESFIAATNEFIVQASQTSMSGSKMTGLIGSFIEKHIALLREKGTDSDRETLTKAFESQGYVTLNFGQWMKKKDYDFIEAISDAKTARPEEYAKYAKKISSMPVPQAQFAAGYYHMLAGEFETAINKFKETSKKTDEAVQKQNIEKIAARLTELLPCKKCQGIGKVICTKCGGTGIIVCRYCGGDGVIEINDMLTGIERKPCTKCTTPKQTCTVCNGEKLMDCPKCDAPWAEILQKNQPILSTDWCDECGRKGYVEGTFSSVCDKCFGLGQTLSPNVKKTDDKEKK